MVKTPKKALFSVKNPLKNRLLLPFLPKPIKNRTFYSTKRVLKHQKSIKSIQKIIGRSILKHI